jgi:hypothetical protein
MGATRVRCFIHRKAVEQGLLAKEDSQKFYEERKIRLSI